jgi:hypothetical protein
MRVDLEIIDKISTQGDTSRIASGEEVVKAQKEAKAKIEHEKEMGILRGKEKIRKDYKAKSDEEKYNDFLVIYNMVVSERIGEV